MKGDPLRLKDLCPDWQKCLDRVWEEASFSSEEEAEAYLAYEWCCGCIVCVLLRDKVGCGDECHVRQRYPQYRDDEALFSLAVAWSPEDIYEELEDEWGVEPDLEEVFAEGIRRQIEKEMKLRRAMSKEVR